MEILMTSPKAKLRIDVGPLLLKIGGGLPCNDVIEAFPVHFGERRKIVAAFDKFNLQCLDAYFASGVVQRVPKKKRVHQARRNHKKSAKRADVVRKHEVSQLR